MLIKFRQNLGHIIFHVDRHGRYTAGVGGSGRAPFQSQFLFAVTVGVTTIRIINDLHRNNPELRF